MIPLPVAVSLLLKRAIARVRRIYLVRGLALVGIVWILGIAAVMTADARLVIFDDRIRWAMSAGIALAVLVAAAFAVALPLGRRIDFRKMAKALDARHPELEERFSTLVELSESDAAKAGFSTSLFTLVGKLAEDDAAKIDLRREFPFFGAFRRLDIFLLMLGTLGIGIAVSPNLVGLLFVRAVAPWVDVGNLFASDIVVKPGDTVALAGTVIRIEAAPATPGSGNSATSQPSPYTIRISRRCGTGWSEETTEPMENGVYETTADTNEREWRYRVNAGPAVTRYYHVRVSEKPKYESFIARVDYPEYTGLAPSVYSNAEVAAIRAIEGSRVAFDLKVTEPGTVADFRIGGKPVFGHTMVSNLTSNWSLELVNRDGFRSSMGKHPLTSYQDQPPTIVIESPAAQLPQLPPHAKIPVELTASDDVCVLTPDIRYSIDGAEMRFFHEVDEFASAGGNLWRGKAELDLAMLDLVNARNVRFDILVHDNCPEEYGGPHLVTSTVINVSLAYHEWGLEVADLKEQTKEANALIEDAKKRLRDAERLTRQLRDELKRDGKVAESTERKNESAAHEASEAKKRLEELRDRFENDERFAPLAKPIAKTMEENLKPALEKVENAPFREREERSEEMAKAADELKKAQEQMDELAQRLKDRAEKVDAFEKSKDLANRQEALARSAKEILEERPNDVAKLEAWKRLEEEAVRRADELAKIRPDADLSEARRKMETAARKIDELKRELAEAAKKTDAEKKAAEARAQQEAREAASREQAMSQAEAEQKRAEEAQAKGDARTAEDAQRKAESQLEKAEATPGVKAMQKLATEAQKKVPGEAAKKAQQEASAAREKEQEIRKAIAEGKKSEKDLEALDAALRHQLAEKATAQEKTAAETARDEALRKAGESQKKAGDSLREAAERRSAERRLRRGEKPQAAAEMAKMAEGLERQAAEAQKAAEESLKQGAATEGVQDMQKLASKAAAAAQKSPRSAEKAARAETVQRAAEEALRQEREMRKALQRGEKTEADLEALDRGLRKLAKDKSEEMTKAAEEDARREKEFAERASRQAKELREAAARQAQAQQALRQAAAQRDEERKLRAANNASAADQKAREAERFESQASAAQRAAEDRLERAEATEAVKAMQQRASAMEDLAREAPHTVEKSKAAEEAQKVATEALAREQKIREGILKGDKTEEDLSNFEDELNAGLRKMAAERTAAAAATAAQALKAAREAIGSAEEKEVSELADAALEAKRDELAARQAESRLNDNPAEANALRDAEDALDAVKSADAEQTAREDRILALQQSAAEALERGDRNRAQGLQREIAKAQARAAESAAETGNDEVEETREAANEAQEEAAEATEEASRHWNDETKAEAVKAQKDAMAREREAHEEARAARALDKLAAAGKELAPSPEPSQTSQTSQTSETSQTSPKSQAAQAAEAAAEAMSREVKSQAAALGISGQTSKAKSEAGGQKDKKDGKSAGGGGVDAEVDRLARELKRGDSPDFLKKLFARIGWFKIRGLSKDGLDERDFKDVPREYRDLVRRYFLKLAEENPSPEKDR